MKRLFLVSVFLVAAAFCCLAQESRFQGNIKGSALPGIYWDPHYTADISLGCRFNAKRYLGIGTGCHWICEADSTDPDNSNGFVPAIPLFVDYIRYFPFSRHPRHSFFMGMEAGGAYYVKDLPLKYETSRILPYMNGKIGFDFGICGNVGLNVGFNLIWGCYKGMTLTGGGGHGVAMTFGIRF